MKRKSKVISNPDEIKRFLELDEKTVFNTTFFMENFGEFEGKAKYHPYDIIQIPPNSYGPEGHKNKNSFTTTIGIWVFNKGFIEQELFSVFGYINKTLNKKAIGGIMDKISEAIMEDRIPLATLKNFIRKSLKYSPYVTVLSPSFTMDMLTVTKKIEARKKELVKKYRKELDAGDDRVATKIQDELLDLAKEILKDDPGMDIYNSGAIGSIPNNFKNMFIMKGVIKDPDPNKGYNIVMSSYMDGIKQEDYSNMANSLAAGPYKRAKKTQDGGYWEKLLLVAYQHLKIVSEDCGTKRTIDITLTKDNLPNNLYNYIYDGNKLVELTSENADKFLGHKVKMRFSTLCEQKDGFCRHCVGNMFNRLGIKNVGVTMPQLASKLKNISMKGFHDSQVQTSKIDYMDAFGMKD